MCGMHADGSKATGFKSMVVAQFAGIGLQKDNNAFVNLKKRPVRMMMLRLSLIFLVIHVPFINHRTKLPHQVL